MSFRILGLSPQAFRPYSRCPIPSSPPPARAPHRGRARTSLPREPEHARIGDEILLTSSTASVAPLGDQVGLRSLPAALVIRTSAAVKRSSSQLSYVPAAFDANAMMIDADVVDGSRAAETFERLLANRDAAYLHVHNAKRGCYAARVERAVIPA
jgi:hypothetical protein